MNNYKNYKLVFCAPNVRVYKDPNNSDPQDAFKVECIADEKTYEPKNWALSISESGHLMMILVSKK